MGTNHYALVPVPDLPERIRQGLSFDGYGRVHMGKSSAGWCYSLRVHPDAGIHDLNHWLSFLAEYKCKVITEYDEEISVGTWLMWVINRCWPPGKGAAEGAEGPLGLRRHTSYSSDRYPCRAGTGTWDICNYTFS